MQLEQYLNNFFFAIVETSKNLLVKNMKIPLAFVPLLLTIIWRDKCLKCKGWRGPQSHVQDKKLVSSRPTARIGRIDHVWGDLSAADQAMYNRPQ